MASTENDGREGIELLNSGAIRVWIDGTEYRLRRPRVREFRALRELLQDATEEITAAAEHAQERQAEIHAEADKRDDKSSTADERAMVRKLGRDLTERREELLLSWWVAVGEKLCDGRAWPEVDDMPAWMGATESSTEIVTHWRSVPSLSGVR